MNRNKKYLPIAASVAMAVVAFAGLARGWDLIHVVLPLCLAICLLAGAGWLHQHHKWPYSKRRKGIVVWALLLSPATGLLLAARAGLIGFLGGAAVVWLMAARGWMLPDDAKPHQGNGYAGSDREAGHRGTGNRS